MNCKNCENYHSCKLTKGKTIIDCKYFVSKDDKYITTSDDKFIVVKEVKETGTNECLI